MSDIPPDSPQASSGWHKPATPGAWRAPEKPKKEAGWRVPAIPADLKREPEEAGAWHVPRPEDTPFSGSDEIQVARPPEDELVGIVSGVAETAAPAPDGAEEADLAPEDLMFLIEQEDAEFNTVGMSELVALASLVDEGEPGAEIVSGAESPIPASLALSAEEEEEDEFATEMLSPAERALLEAPEVVPTIGGPTDPAEYARQQLAQLGVSDVEAIETVPGELAGPAEYARQQLAMLRGEEVVDVEVFGDRTAAPQITTQLTPRQQELARKFRQTEEQVRALRAQVRAGQLDQNTFLARLRELMILDDNQVWWMMGVETDKWYKAENNTWVEAEPEVLQAQRRVGIPEAAPSLPYLPESQPQEYSGFTPSGADIRVDKDFMPLPKEVPISDPEYTVPSASAFDYGMGQPDSYAAPTVPSEPYAQPTVMAQPVDYGTIESPFDEAEPPEYDLEREAPYYDEALQEERAKLGRVVAIIAVVGLSLIFLIAAGFVAAAMIWYNGMVDEWEGQIAALEDYQPVFQTLTILDNSGNTIATLGQEGNDRRPVELERVSPYLIHAVISLENERFYDDPGWDMFAIVRAFWQNFTSGEIESGASTITQQVARNLVLRDTEVTAERKVNEVIVAGELTRRYDKNFVLELYLNEVAFFGNGSYGVEAAAQFYFGKSAAELNLPESAFLASIIQSPANNEPVNNRNTTLHLMHVTMDRMVEIGCLDFQHTPPFGDRHFCVDRALVDSPDTAIEISLVETREFRPREYAVRYPHFTQLVQNQLVALFGSNEIYSGGYIVTTTLDSTLQDFAQQALVDHVTRNNINGVKTGAVMVTDPRNGAILALVGSPDFNNVENAGQVDYSRTYQQPGSAIKPVTYSAALQGVDRNGSGAIDSGEYLTPASILWDVETHYANNYTPVNYDRRYHGPTPLRYALQNSYNVTAIKAYEFIGEAHFRATAEAMGLRFIEGAEFNITTAIGSTEVRLYDMLEAYGTIANDGVRMNLYLIESIVDADGNSVPIPAHEAPVQALSPQVAFLMQSILSDDLARAEQFGQNSALTLAGLLPTQNYVATKTGTTDNGRDLWTVGFTTNRVVGVWLGTYDDAPTFNTIGSRTAAPLWNVVMQAALQNNPPSEFTPPNGVIARQICADTGAIPSDICSNVRNEFFIASQPPPPAEEGFGQVLQVDSWTGLLANEFCRENVVEQTFVNITDAYAIYWLNTVGEEYAQRIGLETPVQAAPQGTCDQNTPIPVVRISNPAGGQTIQGMFAVTGLISAERFDRYQIEFAAASDPNNFIIADGPFNNQHPGANSMLGTWDTTGVPNGDYILRLAVFSTEGGYLYRTAMVRVNNMLPTDTPVPAQPGVATPIPSPLPFDQLSPTPEGFIPTPTVDPLG